MRILSLFDGISIGYLALKNCKIKVDEYHAWEIEKNAIEISKKNFPQIQHHGDVTKTNFKKYKNFDILMFGSPCQSLSSQGDKTGLAGKSGLFLEGLRALKEAKPKYVFFENVASMTTKNKLILFNMLKKLYKDVKLYEFDSSYVSACHRPRIYITNIPNVKLPEIECNIMIKDILQTPKEVNNEGKYWLKDYYQQGTTTPHHATITNKTNDIVGYIDTINFKSRSLIRNINSKMTTLDCADRSKWILQNNKVRSITCVEAERLMTMPDNFTYLDNISRSARFQAIGNSWNVKTIELFFKFLKNKRCL